MTDLNKLAAELHEAAVEKGFWSVENALAKHVAKMISELGEAVQEDRCGRPLLYADDVESLNQITDPALFDGRKPEGAAAELADFVMMTMDLCVESEIDIDKYLEHFPYGEYCETMRGDTLALSVPEFVCNLDAAMNTFIDQTDYISIGGALLTILYGTACWLEGKGVDVLRLIELKMEYNKSRPKLHGRMY